MTANAFHFLLEKAQLLSPQELEALLKALQALKNRQPARLKLPQNGAGCMPRKLWLSEDFNAPLSDFDDYC